MGFYEMKIRNVPCYIPEFGETIYADMKIEPISDSLSIFAECAKITLTRPMRGMPRDLFFPVQILGTSILVYAADASNEGVITLVEKDAKPYGYHLGLLRRE